MNKLYVVPTPIGNLDDITIRSLNVLKKVNIILCEDSNTTIKLVGHFNLKAKLISLHKFNEKSRVDEVISLFTKEKEIALVSDAGTPTISDPGQILISELLEKTKTQIIPLPGPTAITTALSASGFKFNSFTFIGFLDKEKNKIIKSISKNINSDLILAYESPNRINKTLKYLYEQFGDFKITIAREMTKIYEEFLRGNISEFFDKKFKGEIVLIIENKNLIKGPSNLENKINFFLKNKLSNKLIIEYLTQNDKYNKNEVYNFLKKKN